MTMIEDKLLAWVIQELEEHAILRLGEFEPVRLMPWSRVYRCLTNKGYVFFKHTPHASFDEGKLIQNLESRFKGAVPTVIATHSLFCCFLMWDAGETLRTVFTRNPYDIALVMPILGVYAKIQKGLTRDAQTLLDQGVMDWRSMPLLEQYENLLMGSDFLKDIGLQQKEIQALVSARSYFKEHLEILDRFYIPPTLEHGDFQDNNILFKEGNLIVSDWGDAVIAHPFFSLSTFIKSAVRHHKIDETPEVLTTIEDFYLDHWADAASKNELRKAYECVKILGDIRWVISFYHATREGGEAAYLPFRDSILKSARDFLENAED
jgi:hypothetical protein